MVEDQDGSLWIGTQWDGIVRLNAHTRKYHARNPEDNKDDGTEFTHIGAAEVGSPFDTVIDLAASADHGVWTMLSSTGGGSLLARFAPGSAEAYSLRGEIYRMKGNFERALADANEALRLDPQQAWTYLRRGRIYENQCEWDKALADMKEAVRLKPNDAGLLVRHTDTYRAIGEPGRGPAVVRQGRRVDADEQTGR